MCVACVYGEADAERVAEAGLVKSNGEGCRLIRRGGVKVNGEKSADANFEVTVL